MSVRVWAQILRTAACEQANTTDRSATTTNDKWRRHGSTPCLFPCECNGDFALIVMYSITAMGITPVAPDAALLTTASDRRVARIPDRIFAAILDGFLLLPAFVTTVVLSAHWNHISASEDGTINLVGAPALEAMSLSLLILCVYAFLSEAFCGRTLGKEVHYCPVRSRTESVG